MKTWEYCTVHIRNGKPVFVERADGTKDAVGGQFAAVISFLDYMGKSGWEALEGSKPAVEYTIQLKRPKPDYEVCSVVIEGAGSFEDNLRAIQNNFDTEGWIFIEVVHALNYPALALFKRPLP